MLYIHWMPTWVHLNIYTNGAVDINNMIQMIENVISLSVLALFFYHLWLTEVIPCVDL